MTTDEICRSWTAVEVPDDVMEPFESDPERYLTDEALQYFLDVERQLNRRDAICPD